MSRLNFSNVLAHFSHSGVDDMADNTCHFGLNNMFANNGLPDDEHDRAHGVPREVPPEHGSPASRDPDAVERPAGAFERQDRVLETRGLGLTGTRADEPVPPAGDRDDARATARRRA